MKAEKRFKRKGRKKSTKRFSSVIYSFFAPFALKMDSSVSLW